jgi:hypothetical protein
VSLLKLIPGGKQARLIIGIAFLAVIAWAVHVVLGYYHRYNSAAFSPGTVSLALNSPTGEAEYTALSLTGMMPGADVYVGLTVANEGSTTFKYSMTSTASGDGTLSKDIRIGVAAVAGNGCSSSAYSSGASLLRDTAGLSNASFSGRALPGAASEYLCFHARFPWGLPNSLQGRSAQATFNFTAQQ